MSWWVVFLAVLCPALILAHIASAYIAGHSRSEDPIVLRRTQQRFVIISVVTGVAVLLLVQSWLAGLPQGADQTLSGIATIPGALGAIAFTSAIAGVASGIGRHDAEGKLVMKIGIMFGLVTVVSTLVLLVVVEAALGALRLPFIG